MAAIDTEHVREIVEIESQDIRVLFSQLKQRSDGFIAWASIDGITGVSGVLPDTDLRSKAAQASYSLTSMDFIGRTHNMQTPTSNSM